jgi:hypothetical protein
MSGWRKRQIKECKEMTQEAMKLALEALEANYLLVNGTETHGGLEQCLDGYYSSCFDTDPINKQTEEAINALKARLAQPAPVPLADEQIEQIWKRVQANDFHDCVQPFARAIEAAHGIKENKHD